MTTLYRLQQQQASSLHVSAYKPSTFTALLSPDKRSLKRGKVVSSQQKPKNNNTNERKPYRHRITFANVNCSGQELPWRFFCLTLETRKINLIHCAKSLVRWSTIPNEKVVSLKSKFNSEYHRTKNSFASRTFIPWFLWLIFWFCDLHLPVPNLASTCTKPRCWQLLLLQRAPSHRNSHSTRMNPRKAGYFTSACRA